MYVLSKMTEEIKAIIFQNLESYGDLESIHYINREVKAGLADIAIDYESGNYAFCFSKGKEEGSRFYFCMYCDGTIYEFYVDDFFGREIKFLGKFEMDSNGRVREEAVKAMLLIGPFSGNSTLDNSYYY